MISEIQSLDNNAIQRLKTFREVLNECLPILTETGKSIQDKFLGKRVPYWAIFCHDVIKRLLEISHFICSSNPPQTGTCIPLKLCLRNMCSDLILGLYVVSIGKDTDELIKFKDSLNFSALNGKIKFAESELKFYTSLGHKEQADSISRNLSDLKSELANSKSKYNNIGYKTGQIRDWSNLSKIASNLAEYSDSDIASCSVVLNGSYSHLSQTEHYAINNRQESFFNEADTFFLAKHACHCNYSIKIFCNRVNALLKK